MHNSVVEVVLVVAIPQQLICYSNITKIIQMLIFSISLNIYLLVVRIRILVAHNWARILKCLLPTLVERLVETSKNKQSGNLRDD